MKKRMIALGLALTLALGSVAAATGGTQADPLVSVGYLEGTYFSNLADRVTGWVTDLLQPTYDDAVDQLEYLAAGYLSDLGAVDQTTLPEGWSMTEQFVSQGGERGDTVSLSLGSGISMASGTATANAALVDITSGAELAAGGMLTAGHRYVTTAQTVITITSRTAQWAMQGVWSTTADGISVIELPFTDVPEDSWYYDAVYYVVEKSLYNGTSDTTFSPMMTMQRGMLTTVLHRLSGSPAVEYSPIFSDVPSGVWYTNGTIWAGQLGVVSGNGTGAFLPGDQVARQQIAVILYNYAKLMGFDVSGQGDLSAFADGGSVASWAKTAMSWAVSVGILQGSNGKVMPANGASRAEVAIMLQRFQTWMDNQ